MYTFSEGTEIGKENERLWVFPEDIHKRFAGILLKEDKCYFILSLGHTQNE